MSERVLCRPGMHAPAAAALVPGGKAYVLSGRREYWVDAALVAENDYWVPVEPMPDPSESAVSGSEGHEGEPDHSPSRSRGADEAAAQGSTSPPSLIEEGEGVVAVCGAAKSNGEPCQRVVDGSEDQCWQHEE